MDNVIAIIPARSGSKTVLDKNITLLSGHPLIAYSIAAAKLSSKINRIIVSTDSEHYANIALSYGADVPFIRPAEYSTDSSTDYDFLIHAMQWMRDEDGYVTENWVHLRPTTPLRDPDVIDKAIDIISTNRQASSLRSGHIAPESPLKWFRLDKTGYFKGLDKTLNTQELYNNPKEFFEDVYIPDGYVDVIKATHILNHKTTHGDKILGFESPVCTEVDSVQEFDYIQFQLNSKGSILLDYLNKISGEH